MKLSFPIPQNYPLSKETAPCLKPQCGFFLVQEPFFIVKQAKEPSEWSYLLSIKKST